MADRHGFSNGQSKRVITRREALQLGGFAGVSLFLASCSGNQQALQDSMNQQIQNSNDAEAHKDDPVVSNVSASDDTKAQSSDSSSSSLDSGSGSSAKLTSGILIASIALEESSSRTSQNDIKFDISLDYIDPTSGGTSNVAQFSNKDSDPCYDPDQNADFSGAGTASFFVRKGPGSMQFSGDYTKMAAASAIDSVHNSIGWIDTNGNYTNVSDKVADTSEFSEAPVQSSPLGFDADGWYYYLENYTEYKRVPVNSLTRASVEDVDDKSTIQAAHTVNKVNDLSKIVPEKSGRTNYSAVTSPDGSQIAFLSTLQAATPELFVVSSSGGEPTKVHTGYDFTINQKWNNDGQSLNYFSIYAWD